MSGKGAQAPLKLDLETAQDIATRLVYGFNPLTNEEGGLKGDGEDYLAGRQLDVEVDGEKVCRLAANLAPQVCRRFNDSVKNYDMAGESVEEEQERILGPADLPDFAIYPVQACARVLCERLKTGPKPCGPFFEKFPAQTLKRAKLALKIKSVRVTSPGQNGGAGRWVWVLPEGEE